jgi:hypothetical protein
MREANREKSGKWAFFQSKNDKDLQDRTAVGGKVNTFVDKEGAVCEAADVVRQVGNTAFYKREDRWVEAVAEPAVAPAPGDEAKRTVRVVKQFSDEYFELIRNNRKFAGAQSLGGLVTVDLGNEIVEVR